MTKKIFILLCLCSTLICAQNVIIVVIDGARYSETFGGGNTYIPHLYDDMRPGGCLFTNFRIAQEGKTETNPGHSSMLTGTWQQIANDGSERPDKPTVFEYFRKELNSTLTENYVLAGKTKLNVLSYSTDSDYGSLYQASTNCSTLNDEEVYSNLISVMDTYSPRLIIVNFPSTDISGHSGIWDDYVNSLTGADSLVYELWQRIQSGNHGYTSTNTTLFVTNDHGRHDDSNGGFTDHGDDCDGCEHIMLLAIGRNVTPGLVNSDIHYQIDIAPTVGDLLNFATPQSYGTSLYDGTNPLPVELNSFTAAWENNAVKLIWETRTEVDNYGFEVQRFKASMDLTGEEWESIGFILGNGNSNTLKSYSFYDKKNATGKLIYRLKQIDNDGGIRYSGTVEVENVIPAELYLEQNFPNPFNPVTKIKFSIPSVETGHAPSLHVTLKVFDVLGNEIETLVNEEKPVGNYELRWNAESLPSGVYFYQLKAGEFTDVKKMLLIK
ncbi:MAG: T9SS type A sorting domain-containing protein [Ignavibacteriales bacterium]|nr:MAG: T9SS type A sorting domain-containing protein [Ignavibacteriales bacterium]